jgi:tRNA threonylcarbamoyladenosine biosynthesis protein TsaE
MTNSLLLSDTAATEHFGALLYAAGARNGIITLNGDLGAGKTTLCRGLLRAMGHQGPVKSPTYTLVELYELDHNLRIAHFDLYRLADPEELEYIGFRDILADSLCLIEWPARGRPLLPTADLDLTLTVEGSGRRINWLPATEKGQILSQRLNTLCATSQRP